MGEGKVSVSILMHSPGWHTLVRVHAHIHTHSRKGEVLCFQFSVEEWHCTEHEKSRKLAGRPSCTLRSVHVLTQSLPAPHYPAACTDRPVCGLSLTYRLQGVAIRLSLSSPLSLSPSLFPLHGPAPKTCSLLPLNPLIPCSLDLQHSRAGPPSLFLLGLRKLRASCESLSSLCPSFLLLVWWR